VIMTGQLFFRVLMGAAVGLGAAVFVILFFIPAPYGRHNRSGWGPQIDSRVGWIIMESMAPAAFFLFFLTGDWKTGVMPYVFLGLWMLHYLYRAFLFPLLMRGSRTMPAIIALFAVLFNTMNAYLQAGYLYHLSPGSGKYAPAWLVGAPFLVGVLLFLAGLVIHVWSDTIARNLRAPGESGYRIPRGGLFRWISSPNYFGEIVEWTGWAVLTWSLPGLVFAFWTAANLVPRAYWNHKWYRRRFPDYPENRRAVIPFVL